jgi:hypothetical protein
MRFRLRHGAAALALVASSGLAVAQGGPPNQPNLPTAPIEHPLATGTPPPSAVPLQLQLTVPQRTAIVDAVRAEKKSITPPPNFAVSVGSPVPPQLELYVLPDRALATVPEARSVKYTVVQKQIVLVDPTTMRVVDVISQ